MGALECPSPKDQVPLKPPLPRPPSCPRRAPFGGRELNCEQREDVNIIPRLWVSHRGGLTSVPFLSQDPPPHQGEGMPAKGTHQEFIHSHPTPSTVQVMPSARLSPLGSSRAWIRLISFRVLLPSPSQQFPCPARPALMHFASQGHSAISEDTLLGGVTDTQGTKASDTAKHPRAQSNPSTQKCPTQNVRGAYYCN